MQLTDRASHDAGDHPHPGDPAPLRHLALFSTLGAASLAALETFVQRYTYRQGYALCDVNAAHSPVYVIGRGRLRLDTLSPAGAETPMYAHVRAARR